MGSRNAVPFILAFALSLAVSRAQSDPAASLSLTSATPADPALASGTLPNGLRYYVRTNRRPEKRAVLRLVVNAGSVLEDDDQRGLGHFVEHMAFNGTRSFPRSTVLGFLASIGSNVGPDANATTNFDETIYALEVRSDRAGLDGALLVLEEWAHNLSFDAGAVDGERPVVLEEWRQRLGAGARLRDKETPVLLQGSRYADRVPIGTPETIRTFNPSRLRQFYADWYRPDLMAVVAVGDFDALAVRGLLESHFAGLAGRPAARVRPQYTMPAHSGTRFFTATDPESPRTTISLATRLPPRAGSTVGGYRQIIADRLVTSILNARFSGVVSRPDSPLVRVTAARRPFVARGVDESAIAAVVRDDRVERAFETLLTEVERVRRFGFNSEEIDRQRQNALRAAERLVADAESRDSSVRADEYVRNFLRGDPVPSMEDQAALYRRFVPEIPVGELNAIAREWLGEDNRVIEISAPDNARAVLPSEARLSDIASRVPLTLLTPYVELAAGTALLSSLPAGGAVVSETTNAAVGLTEWTFANGVRVVLKPTAVRNDEVIFRASRLGGTSLVDDEEFMRVSGAAQIVAVSGSGEYSGVELRRLLTGTIATVTPFINELEEGLGGTSSPKDLETLFQLIYLRFGPPRRDPAAFALLKAQITSGLVNQNASPDFLFRNTLATALTSDHLRRRSLDAAAVNRWDLDRALAFYRQRFTSARGFTFVFVGNVSPDVLRPLAAQYLGALPASDGSSTWRDVGVRQPPGVIERTVLKGIEPKSQVAIAFTGPFDYSEANRLALRAVALLLQSRLNDAIREDLGGTYAIGVAQSTQPVPRATYDLRIQWSCAPQRVERLTKRVFEEISALKSTPLSELVVRGVRSALERDIQGAFQTNTYVLSQLVLKYELGEDPSDVWNYAARLQALSATSIRAAAERYLDTSRYVQVTLMPEIGSPPRTVAGR